MAEIIFLPASSLLVNNKVANVLSQYLDWYGCNPSLLATIDIVEIRGKVRGLSDIRKWLEDKCTQNVLVVSHCSYHQIYFSMVDDRDSFKNWWANCSAGYSVQISAVGKKDNVFQFHNSFKEWAEHNLHNEWRSFVTSHEKLTFISNDEREATLVKIAWS